MDTFDPMAFNYACVCGDPTQESCPVHTPPERVQKVLDGPLPVMASNEGWEEVTMCRGDEQVFHAEELPNIYVARGSQLYRLRWPELPPVDPTKTSMR